MASNTRQGYDVASMLGSENGQRRLDEVDLREEDGFELVADEVLGAGRVGELLNGSDDSYKAPLANFCDKLTRCRMPYLQTCSRAEYQFYRIPAQPHR